MGTQFWVTWGPNGDLRQHKWGPKKRIFNIDRNKLISWNTKEKNYGENIFTEYGFIWCTDLCHFQWIDRCVSENSPFNMQLTWIIGLAWDSLKLVLPSQRFKWSSFSGPKNWKRSPWGPAWEQCIRIQFFQVAWRERKSLWRCSLQIAQFLSGVFWSCFILVTWLVTMWPACNSFINMILRPPFHLSPFAQNSATYWSLFQNFRFPFPVGQSKNFVACGIQLSGPWCQKTIRRFSISSTPGTGLRWFEIVCFLSSYDLNRLAHRIEYSTIKSFFLSEHPVPFVEI